VKTLLAITVICSAITGCYKADTCGPFNYDTIPVSSTFTFYLPPNMDSVIVVSTLYPPKDSIKTRRVEDIAALVDSCRLILSGNSIASPGALLRYMDSVQYIGRTIRVVSSNVYSRAQEDAKGAEPQCTPAFNRLETSSAVFQKPAARQLFVSLFE